MRLAIATSILAQTLPVSAEHHPKVYDFAHVSRNKQRGNGILLSGVDKNDNTHLGGSSSRGRHLNLSLIAEPLLRGGGTLQNIVGVVELVKCDPSSTSKDAADVGILGCGANQYCIESKDSSLGGVCTSEQQQQQRKMEHQQWLSSEVCDPNSMEYETYECDCSGFDLDTQEGSFSCTLFDYYCFERNACGAFSVQRVIGPNDFESAEYCYDFVTPRGIQVCYGVDKESNCQFSVGGVQCNACEVAEGITDSVNGFQHCYEFDCTNTAAGNAGIDCLGEYVLDAVFLEDTPGSPSSTTPILCGVCGLEGKPPSLDSRVDISPSLQEDCAALEDAANRGGITAGQCESLPSFVLDACGCIPFDATLSPTSAPSTPSPTSAPADATLSPTSAPSTPSPTSSPSDATLSPTSKPSPSPTIVPTRAPTTVAPVPSPTATPTPPSAVLVETAMPPSVAPSPATMETEEPSSAPTMDPPTTSAPTTAPPTTSAPSTFPSIVDTSSPSPSPSAGLVETGEPSSGPSVATMNPSESPTQIPETAAPSTVPSLTTSEPSTAPSGKPVDPLPVVTTMPSASPVEVSPPMVSVTTSSPSINNTTATPEPSPAPVESPPQTSEPSAASVDTPVPTETPAAASPRCTATILSICAASAVILGSYF